MTGSQECGIALVLGLAFGFFAGEQCAGKPDLAAVQRADNLALALAQADSALVASQRVAALRGDSIRASEATIRRLANRLPDVRITTDSFVALVPDTQLIRGLEEALVTERAISDSAQNATSEVVRLLRVDLAEVTGQRDQYRAMAQEFQRQLHVAVNRPAPHSKLVDLALLAGGYAVGRLTK